MRININNEDIIITTDNAGSIGEKELDNVKAPYDILSYLTTRNAVMENLSHNTLIKAIIFHNYCGDESYAKINEGINKIITELGYDVPVSSSTESNFTMSESAFGVTVIGESSKYIKFPYNKYAVVGKPLVGNEVLQNKKEMITLKECISLINNPNVSRVFTVGSKGIKDRLQTIIKKDLKTTQIDMSKSAGPSTCVIIEYKENTVFSEKIQNKLTKLN